MKSLPGALALSALLLIPSNGVAAEPVSSILKGVTLDGFVSFGYTYNFNKPNGGAGATDLNGFRLFDEDVNTFNVDVAELVVQKPVSKPGDAGFRVDVAAGGAIPEKTASLGLNLGGVGEVNFDLQQAFASYIFPVGSGLKMDFGKFVTHMGYEVIEGYDGYNDHYSRSLSFNYAIPFTHTGLRGSYAFNDMVTLTGAVVNGWDQVEDVNNSKSICAQLVVKPISDLTVTFDYMGGPEQVNDNDHMRNLYEAIVVWKPLTDFTLAGIYTAGREDSASIASPGRQAHWDAYGAYVKYDWSHKLSFALRGERFDDRDATRLLPLPAGISANVRTNISEITFTPAYKFTDNFLIRVEGRWDKANRNIFMKNNGILDDQQTTLAANAIFTF